ncbi:MAG: ABC transporter permease [Chloroflexota bacterium]|nr:ABC transporter permease [Chloroflexota bacterium]
MSSIDSAPVSAGQRRGLPHPLLVLGTIVPLLFVAVPLVALLWRTFEDADGVFADETREKLLEALRLSALTTAIALGLVILFGTPLAYTLARRSFRGSRIVDTVVDLPIVLPPAVAGIALLMAFGRRGLVGEYLDDWGIRIGFTTAAVVIAQAFVSLPFYVRSVKAGFSTVHRDLEGAAETDGATPFRAFLDITLPLAAPSIAAGAVLAWARALGEFGATIMFAGNLAGRTQTMPLAIYGEYESGDLSTALALSTILLVISAMVLLVSRSSLFRPRPEG